MAKKVNRKFRILLFIVFFSFFIFSLVNLIRWYVFNNRSKKDIERIKSTVVVGNMPILDADGKENKIKKPIDFDTLRKVNSDIVAWIKIDNTNIDYPVLQTSDNEYYLHKDINKKYSTCGWIFMDWKNSEKLIDKNTVLYGHNIKSGIMFADLLKIAKEELGKDINIEIYTDKKKVEYKVFSSYFIEPEDYSIKSNIVTEDSMEQYVKEMVSRSSINYNIMPTKTDNVLTLSTCDNSGNNRVLVHAVLINEIIYD